MEAIGSRLIFSTGKEIVCYGEVVGLNAGNLTLALHDQEYVVHGGWDDNIVTILDTDDYDESEASEILTKEECIELAEHMVRKWQEFMAIVKGG